MGVIYCNNCNRGVHYIDKCRGGKNGVPRMSEKKDKFWTRIENTVWIMFALALLGAFASMIYMISRIAIG